MILGVISDTHDKLARTRTAVQMLRDHGAEAIVHCGDLETPPILKECAVLPCWFVFGNNDDSTSELRKTATDLGAVCLEFGGLVELDGRRIGVTHGHSPTDLEEVMDRKVEYMLFGHSHCAEAFHENGVRFINPGALHRASTYTVALLDLKNGEVKWLKVPR